MANESYVGSIKPKLAERAARLDKTRMAANMLREIIRDHTIFEGNRSRTVPAYWDEANPEEIVWFDLYDSHWESLEESHLAALSKHRMPSAVSKANFVFSTETIRPTAAFTIDFDKDRILGANDELLTAAQIDGVIGDLGRYAAAIAAGRTDPAV